MWVSGHPVRPIQGLTISFEDYPPPCPSYHSHGLMWPNPTNTESPMDPSPAPPLPLSGLVSPPNSWTGLCPAHWPASLHAARRSCRIISINHSSFEVYKGVWQLSAQGLPEQGQGWGFSGAVQGCPLVPRTWGWEGVGGWAVTGSSNNFSWGGGGGEEGGKGRANSLRDCSLEGT